MNRLLVGTLAAAALTVGLGVGLTLAVTRPAGPGVTSAYPSALGGALAPGWMSGGTLPRSMMGGGADPGRVMGTVLATAPGPRISLAAADHLSDRTPAAAVVNRAQRRITFHGGRVVLAAVASGPAAPMYSFEIAGIVNPTIVVPARAHVSIEVANRDTDMAHGLVIAAEGAASSWMPMMTAAPAFPGAAVWVLGDATSAGLHATTMHFTVGAPGTYQYLCPVPGHAAEGMVGTLTVTG